MRDSKADTAGGHHPGDRDGEDGYLTVPGRDLALTDLFLDEPLGGLLPERYRGPVPIGTGAMATIYRARDERLGRDVAVKVPSPAAVADETNRRRFIREATAAARVRHPNVATIYDVGEHDGRPYLVMELVEGGNLEDRLARGRPPRAEALRLIAQAAAALDAAHAAGVVHRDVKPSNLLLDEAGTVKVADFGIARVLGDSGTLTAPGTVLGSFGYASPEQALGEPTSPASDVYSLAAVAFELLTGDRPYGGRRGIAELAAHAHEPVPNAGERAPELPARVDAVLARALAKDPSERFPSARAFAAALERACTSVHPTAVLPAPEPATATARRRWPGGLAAIGAFAALLIGAAAVGIVTAGAGGGDNGDGLDAPAVVTMTTTRPAAAPPPRTVVETVTREVPVVPVEPEPEPTSQPPAAGAPTYGDAVALTDRATAAQEDGDPAQALALADRALLALGGTGDDYEGNASYDRGRALIDLGRCGEAVAALERSIAIGGTTWQMRVRRETLDEARACVGG